MNHSNCIWSRRVKWITCMGMAVIVAAIVYSGYVYGHTDDLRIRHVVLTTMIVLAVLMVAAMLLTPRYVEVSKETVRIRLLCTSVNIPKEEIEKIEHLPSGMASVRIVGMGYFFGNVGLFHSEYYGRYYSLVTNEQDICLIYRKHKKPIAVSVPDTSVFSAIAAVKEV